MFLRLQTRLKTSSRKCNPIVLETSFTQREKSVNNPAVIENSWLTHMTRLNFKTKGTACLHALKEQDLEREKNDLNGHIMHVKTINVNREKGCRDHHDQRIFHNEEDCFNYLYFNHFSKSIQNIMFCFNQVDNRGLQVYRITISDDV